jgi:hypothetical protein
MDQLILKRAAAILGRIAGFGLPARLVETASEIDLSYIADAPPSKNNAA